MSGCDRPKKVMAGRGGIIGDQAGQAGSPGGEMRGLGLHEAAFAHLRPPRPNPALSGDHQQPGLCLRTQFP